MYQYESIEFLDTEMNFIGVWNKSTEAYIYYDSDPRWIMKAKLKEVRNKFKKGKWIFIKGVV